ncbi:hypothetical protein [Streptomyces rimosus]|uniref:hypothetical protein n=1 Tax=Streptomyces rimosus TaxID=1927 RepID=UPI000B2B775B|nr:hypothetical protein [Streptomyces rimosus]
MPKSHSRKKKTRARQRASGAPYVSAKSGAAHWHPGPDLTLPNAGIEPIDRTALENVRRLIGAGWQECASCQRSLANTVVTSDPAALMLMAFYIYGGLPDAGSLASAATHRFAAAAPTAKASGDLQPLLATVRAMSRPERAELVEDTMDMWVGMHAMNIIPEAHTSGSPARPAVSETAECLPDALFLDTAQLAPPRADYRLHPALPDGEGDAPPMPVLWVEPHGPAAGRDDLVRRCGFTPVTDEGGGDPLWLLHVNEDLGALREVARLATDACGQRRTGWSDDLIDLHLSTGSIMTPLPSDYLGLLRSTSEVRMIGPAANAADAAARAEQGQLLSARARVVFDFSLHRAISQPSGSRTAPTPAAGARRPRRRHPSPAELPDLDITPAYDPALGPCIDMTRFISDAVYDITLTRCDVADKAQPVAVLHAISGAAGAADLKYRCLWQQRVATLPPVDKRWLVTVDSEQRTITSVSHDRHDADRSSGESHIYPLTLTLRTPRPQLTPDQVDHVRALDGLVLVGPLEPDGDLDDAWSRRDLLLVHATVTVA